MDSNTIKQIEEQLQAHTILLYMKGSADLPQCGFSARAVQLLQACGAQFETVDILIHPNIRSELPKYANWPTFPQLYIQGELIGGADILYELYEKGELQEMITKVQAEKI